MNQYETHDFYLAAWFLMNGIDLKIKNRDNNKMIFVCDDFQDRDVLINSFYKFNVLQKYIVSIKSLKNKMYSKNPPVIYQKGSNKKNE
jgi:hypothetical protein